MFISAVYGLGMALTILMRPLNHCRDRNLYCLWATCRSWFV